MSGGKPKMSHLKQGSPAILREVADIAPMKIIHLVIGMQTQLERLERNNTPNGSSEEMVRISPAAVNSPDPHSGLRGFRANLRQVVTNK